MGIIAGLEAEAALIRPFFPQAVIALSHVHEAGALAALQRLREAGVTEVLSFGCAGGLDPALRPGTVVVADEVVLSGGGRPLLTDPGLSRFFGRTDALGGRLLHSPCMIASADDKARLHRETGCRAVDMESGVAAASGLPFAVLRVVCDGAERNLPPAAAEGMRKGRIWLPGLLSSLLRHPGQIGGLIRLGREAAQARQAMQHFLAARF